MPRIFGPGKAAQALQEQGYIPDAIDVLAAWNLVFRTVAFIWVKMPARWTPESGRVRPRLGLGYHTRSGAEQCWLAMRGSGYKRQCQGIEQVIHAPLRAHSQKPDEIIERIELFARARRPGWVCHGDEVGKLRHEPGQRNQFPPMAGETADKLTERLGEISPQSSRPSEKKLPVNRQNVKEKTDE